MMEHSQTKDKSEWLSVYIFSNESLDELLVKAVFPFLDEVRRQKLLTRYFFIRYEENGDHIRLRMKGKTELLRDSASHFFKYPITFIKYEPEIDRYGGTHGIVVSERYFCNSSETVRTIMTSKRIWNYEKALEYALKMHIVFVFGIGMNCDGAFLFFNMIYTNWLRYTKRHPRANSESMMRLIGSLSRSFEDNKEPLRSFCLSCLRLTTTCPPPLKETWISQWFEKMKNIGAHFDGARDDGSIVTKQSVIPTDISEASQIGCGSKSEFWHIFVHYYHMTNNRLGVKTYDEGYLAFLLRETFALLADDQVRKAVPLEQS